MLCLLQFIITNKQQTNPTMAQQQELYLQEQELQHQVQVLLHNALVRQILQQRQQTHEETMTTHGKLEIQEFPIQPGRHDLCPETKELLHNLLCQWTRDNYQEIVKMLDENNCQEYGPTINLSNAICENILIDENESLIGFIVNSGIIQNYRVSIYLYCCDEMQINIDAIDQTPDNALDIANNQDIAAHLLSCYTSSGSPDKLMANEFIEIRDNPISLK